MTLGNGRIQATYEREIEHKPINNVLFYGGLAVVISLVVFIFGIRPIVLALAQNRAYERELEQIRDSMVLKLSQIQSHEEILREQSRGVQALNSAIPNNASLQEFLAELVLKAANSGFAVERVKESEIAGDIIRVDIEATGEVSRLSEFIQEIEDMARFTTIQSINLDTDGPLAIVRFRMEIYKL